MSKNRLRLYLDNCCFNRPYDNQEEINIKLESLAKLYVQNSIKNKKFELVWSYILKFENDHNPYLDKRIAIEKWRDLSINVIEENEEIIKKAELLQSYGIKVIDALHIACAIQGQCGYFLTTDKGILNKSELVEEITILNPLEFVSFVEKN